MLNVILSVQQQALDANQQNNFSINPELETLLDAEILEKHQAIIQKQAEETTNDFVKIIPHVEYNLQHFSVNDYMR